MDYVVNVKTSLTCFSLFLSLSLFFFLFVFWGCTCGIHMEVPRPGVQLEL